MRFEAGKGSVDLISKKILIHFNTSNIRKGRSFMNYCRHFSHLVALVGIYRNQFLGYQRFEGYLNFENNSVQFQIIVSVWIY